MPLKTVPACSSVVAADMERSALALLLAFCCLVTSHFDATSATTMSCLLLLLACAAVTMATPIDQSPAFCNHLECPKFSVLNKTQDYELRHYEPVKWVTTNASGASLDDQRHAMFMRLFHYIDGNNTKSVKIPMTAPVMTTVTHGAGPNCASTFTMHFLLPADQWSSPVPPTDPLVYITTTPAMDVYVRVFGGYAGDANYLANLVKLSETLTRDKANFEDSHYFIAGYDSPYKFTNRHNEIWLASSQ